MTVPPDEAESALPMPPAPPPRADGAQRGVRQRTSDIVTPAPSCRADDATPAAEPESGSATFTPDNAAGHGGAWGDAPFSPMDAGIWGDSGIHADVPDMAGGTTSPPGQPPDNPARLKRLRMALVACGAAVTIGMGGAIALLMEEGTPPLRLGTSGAHPSATAAAPTFDTSGTSGPVTGLSGAGAAAAAAACPLPGGADACPPMVAIPAGRYRIGSRRNDPDAQDEELGGAERPVAAFELSAHEITAGQWQLCINDGACPAPVQPAESSVMPVTGISWDAAAGYAAWLSHKTGLQYRLPTELEWEYAARAGGATVFPWGERLGQRNAHCGQCGTLNAYPRFAPVGSYPPRNGLYDMVGNAYEWVADCWTANHAQPVPPPQAACGEKVQKGGAYDTLEADVRPVARTHGDRGAPDVRVGFRVARQPLRQASNSSRTQP